MVAAFTRFVSDVLPSYFYFTRTVARQGSFHQENTLAKKQASQFFIFIGNLLFEESVYVVHWQK